MNMRKFQWKRNCLILIAALSAVLVLLLLFLMNRCSTAKYAKYAEEETITLTFSDTGITAAEGAAGGYEIDGTSLTIDTAGTYVLSGSCSDGSITVKKGTVGVTLVLNGLTLESSDTAPIVCGKSTSVTITAAADTVNTLSDSAMNNDESYPDNENAENAVIKCRDGSQVTINGSGTLRITANGKNGIKSGASTSEDGEAALTIQDVSLNITASVNDAINAEQLLNIESGTITILAADDAIHSDYELNIGSSDTDGPTIIVIDCYEGLEAADLRIDSGSISITATDDCLNAANSDLSDYSFTMEINGGTISAFSSAGDGLDSNGTLTITGGTVSVWTASTMDNQPLDADGALTISGGTVFAAGGSGGMGMSLTDSQAYLTVSGDRLISEGGALCVTDSTGEPLYSETALCDVAFVFFSSGDLISGDSYTISQDGADIAKADASTGSAMIGGGQNPGGAPEQGGSQAPGNGNPVGTPPADGTLPGSDDSINGEEENES